VEKPRENSRGHYEKPNGLPKFLAGHYVPLSTPFPGILGIHGELLKTDIGQTIHRRRQIGLCLDARTIWSSSRLLECSLHIDLKTGITSRITPPGVADFSPAISPSGQLLVTSFALPSFSGNLEDVRKLCNLIRIHALSS
jgi:hypothetical protein